MNPRINKALDFIERVGWTLIEVYVSLGLLDWLSSGMNLNFLHQVYAALGAAVAATIKVLIAQRVGSADDGAMPSPIQPPPKT